MAGGAPPKFSSLCCAAITISSVVAEIDLLEQSSGLARQHFHVFGCCVDLAYLGLGYGFLVAPIKGQPTGFSQPSG